MAERVRRQEVQAVEIPRIQGYLQSVVVGIESIRGLSDVLEIRKLAGIRPCSCFSGFIGTATGCEIAARADNLTERRPQAAGRPKCCKIPPRAQRWLVQI